MKYQYIKQQCREGPPVESLCEALRVSRSGYYRWRKQSLYKAQLEGQYREEIMQAWENSNQRYGVPRVYEELQSKGVMISKKKVAKVMKELGISGMTKKASRGRSSAFDPSYPVAERLLKTEDKPLEQCSANEIWVSDITYIRLQQGFCYLAIFMDLATRKIVGYSVSDSLQAELVIEALNRAIGMERPAAGLIIHSDRGVQYRCESYRELLAQYGFKMSMSRKGNCYDNAFAESFFASLKGELIRRNKFKTMAQARTVLFEYIEVWYNRQRRHSSLGYMCPVDYEKSIAKRPL